mgnify:CR=1 FL=1
MKHWLGMFVVLGLAGCASDMPAPITDRGPSATRPTTVTTPPRPVTAKIAPSDTGFHTVQKGDTLFAIAFANSLDFRELARWNNLESADVIHVGQVLRLTSPDTADAAAKKGVEIQPLEIEARPQAQALKEAPLLREPQAVLLPYSEANWALANAPRAAPVPTPVVAPPAPAAPPAPTAPTAPAPATPAPAPAPAVVNPAPATVEAWVWPASGALKGRFGEAGGKGIDIVAERNTPVLAAAPGRVVYSGAGLRGYGRLVIIKHPGEYLSAYAHNQEILVKEGDAVNAGQKIALMGDSDADRVKLHFEIRQYGRPLDPLKYLPSPP